MPFMYFRRGDKWYVHKRGADGQPEGRRLGSHDDEQGAAAQWRLLEDKYKHESKAADKYAAVDFRPSEAMARQAERALSLCDEEGHGCKPTAIVVARQIARRQLLSPRTVRALTRFFGKDRDKSSWNLYKPGKAQVDYMLRGGDAGERWCQSCMEQMGRIDEQTAVKAALLSQADVVYVPDSPHEAQLCANCRWFTTAPAGLPCHLVVNGPAQIEPEGYCDRWEAMPAGGYIAYAQIPSADADEETAMGKKVVNTSNAGSVGFGVGNDEDKSNEMTATAKYHLDDLVRVKAQNADGTIVGLARQKGGGIMYHVSLEADGGMAICTAGDLERRATRAVKQTKAITAQLAKLKFEMAVVEQGRPASPIRIRRILTEVELTQNREGTPTLLKPIVAQAKRNLREAAKLASRRQDPANILKRLTQAYVDLTQYARHERRERRRVRSVPLQDGLVAVRTVYQTWQETGRFDAQTAQKGKEALVANNTALSLAAVEALVKAMWIAEGNAVREGIKGGLPSAEITSALKLALRYIAAARIKQNPRELRRIQVLWLHLAKRAHQTLRDLPHTTPQDIKRLQRDLRNMLGKVDISPQHRRQLQDGMRLLEQVYRLMVRTGGDVGQRQKLQNQFRSQLDALLKVFDKPQFSPPPAYLPKSASKSLETESADDIEETETPELAADLPARLQMATKSLTEHLQRGLARGSAALLADDFQMEVYDWAYAVKSVSDQIGNEELATQAGALSELVFVEPTDNPMPWAQAILDQVTHFDTAAIQD